MNRKPHLILVALIVAALVGVAALAMPGSPAYQEPTLGLDLQGGLEVTLQAVPPRDRALAPEDLERSVEILRNRIDALGVSEPEIRTQGDDQIVIDMPGITNPEQVIEVLGRTAQLELYDLQVNLLRPSIDAQGFPVATPTLYELLAGQQALVNRAQNDQWYLFDDDRKLRAGPTAEREALLQSQPVDKEGELGELPDGWRIFGVPPRSVVLSCGIGEVVCPGVNEANPSRNYWYLMRYDRSAQAVQSGEAVPEMTGADLVLEGTRADFDPTTSEPIVTMQFTDSGADKFAEITAEEARRGKSKSQLLGQKVTANFAIVLDREIKSWPSIDWEQYPNGIGGQNGAQITGIGSIDEARNLALVLQTGALPVTFRTLDTTAISATLGKDSLAEAWKAAIAGLLVVALFLLVFYRFLGLVAVLGLGIYSAFLYAAILLFNVTLTLPGFAGMILTLGVAADANIVIFERVKEEYRAGKSVRAAIAAGYGKGFSTIIDANVVTAITAVILFLVATAGVKGFALMLLIGTLMSLLTAVAATRAILGLLAGFNWFDNPKFMGAEGEPPKWIRRDFVGRRNVWFAIAAAFIAVSLGSIALQGLNLGIDFKGGTQITFSTDDPVGIEQVRSQAATIGQEDAQIFGRGEELPGERYREFSIRTENLPQAEQTRLTNELERTFETETSVRSVSGSFGRQIAEGAVLAILVSLLLIVGYISARFQWKFSVPVLVALLHDVVITVGIYSLLDREVTTATVAAILTVLGFSIYDTIIILDRIRENIPLMKRASFRVLTNVSLWETIPRSLATTFITLLPITTLYFFGGETLKDFAFALLVGIGAGAYSSIFIAAPLLAVFKEREPEYARKRDDESLEGVTSVGLLLREAEEAAAAQPTPELVPAAAPGDLAEANRDTDGDGDGDGDGAHVLTPRVDDAKRERRRQRRKTRPHGRAR
ncbi:MAG TPA: protein translocase subunit SecD [Gaiellaceae bacterium]|nr:protein translocase subunit SecD [Gaiellaceae bacterium]